MNFFLLYHALVFSIFYSVYLNFMIFLPKLWKGIENKEDRKLLCNIADSFYFTVCTHSSLGYGDITPKSRMVRMITSVHMISVFVPFIIDYL